MHEYTTLSVTPEVAEEIRRRREEHDGDTSAVLKDLLPESDD